MQYKYPMFQKNRILKTEALIAIRDYGHNQMWLEWLGYSPGILSGCHIHAQDGELAIMPGILKCQDKILLLPEAERITYQATNCMQYLKAQINIDDASPEFITYEVTLNLGQSENSATNEIELCRFHLRQGATLREQYKDFFDLETEYDTINPIFSVWGSKGGQTLSPHVTQFFAEQILQTPGKRMEDVVFAYACLNQPTGVAHSVLKHYVNDFGNGNKEAKTNQELYWGLCKILKAAQSGKRREDIPKHERRKILMD